MTVEKVYSKGLYFRSNGDGTCALAGIGSCTAKVGGEMACTAELIFVLNPD
ncbi:MAG: hypothetical protein IJW22_03810 [Clostridia bacterium]|nr:hypothetical protein [Clostridia bacterium]